MISDNILPAAYEYLGLIGSGLLIEAHPMYAGIAFGMGIREFLIAFK